MAALTLEQAQRLCLYHMERHGLTAKGWTFGWNNRKSAFGLCCPRKRRILLSKYFIGKVSSADILDTILHEIAHSIDFDTRGVSDHGPVWKAIAQRVGANPKSTKDTVITKKNPYLIKFGDEVVSSWSKLPADWQQRLKGMYVKGRKAETIGKLRVVRVTYKDDGEGR